MIPELIYIHNPKTGGLSICNSYHFPTLSMHATPHDWRIHLGDDKYASAYKIITVRNPYDRLLSAWAYHATMTPESKYWPSNRSCRPWVYKYGNSFERFVLSFQGHETQRHFRPQVHWMDDNIDRVLRFETLADDWAKLCHEFSLPCSELPHENASIHQPWRELYTPAMIRRVNDVYSADFERLDYDLC